MPALASLLVASAAAAGPALHFRSFTTEDGLPQGSVRALAQTPDGYLWIATLDGLVRFDGMRMTVFSRSELPEMPSNRCLALFVDRNGSLWVGTEDAGSFRLDGGRVRRFDGPSQHPDAAYTFAEDDTGRLWSITNSGAAVFDGERWKLAPESMPRPRAWQPPAPWPEVPSVPRQHPQAWPRWSEGLDGRFWVLDGGYIERRDGSTWTLFSSPLPDGLLSTPVALFEDREGSLWIGGEPGLVQATPTPVRAVMPEKPAGMNAYTVALDAAGRAWIGTMSAPFLWENGTLTMLGAGQTSGWPPDWIMAIEPDVDGALLCSGPNGTSRVWPGRRFEKIYPGYALDTLRDRHGTLWIANGEDVLRQSGKDWERVEQLQGIGATVLEESRDGGVWVGSRAGIARAADGHVDWWPAKGSWSSSVRALREDEAGSLWIGTYDAGLVRFSGGKFVSIRKRDGLWDDGVFTILDDGRGRYWMSSNRGVYSVEKRALDDLAERRSRGIACRAWRGADGLPSTECNGGRQPSGWKAADGTLWFPTQAGIAIIDPRAVRENAVPPPVVVEEVTTDHRTFSAGEPVVLEPGERRLEVRYTANTFIRPEGARFRHRLEGLDADWIDAGTRRHASYAHVPPGRYVLRILAANSDGVWGHDGASLSVRVLPYWWETLWFRSGAVLLALSILGGGYRRRVAHLKRRRAEQDAFARRLIESQEAERKRIAGELHDGIGQTLVVIRNRALLGARDGGEPASVRQMDEIATVAGEGIEEVRKVAYGLRPYQLDRLGLKRALEALVEQTAESSAIAMTAEIGDLDRAFAKDDEINVYRIVQEGVANMVRYSQARSGRVTVAAREREIEIRVEDDGVGFDASASGGHRGLGLSGIAERARILGGASVIRSAPNAGTTVIVVVPRRGEP